MGLGQLQLSSLDIGISQIIISEKMINIFHIFKTKKAVSININTYFPQLTSSKKAFQIIFQANNFSLGVSSNFQIYLTFWLQKEGQYNHYLPGNSFNRKLIVI